MIANKGLPEYETSAEKGVSIYLTLLRCVGSMNKDMLLTRKGGAAKIKKAWLTDLNEKIIKELSIKKNEIRLNIFPLGLDITDFGSGTFDKVGLLLFTIRNGTMKELEKEDGMDGVKVGVKAGGTIVLTPGESVCLPSRLYHKFWGQDGKGTVLVGEVSRVNDDRVDNRFYGLNNKDIYSGLTESATEKVKECIRMAAPGGGYIFAIGGETYPGVSPDTLIKLVSYVKEMGKYPIKRIYKHWAIL